MSKKYLRLISCASESTEKAATATVQSPTTRFDLGFRKLSREWLNGCLSSGWAVGHNLPQNFKTGQAFFLLWATIIRAQTHLFEVSARVCCSRRTNWGYGWPDGHRSQQWTRLQCNRGLYNLRDADDGRTDADERREDVRKDADAARSSHRQTARSKAVWATETCLSGRSKIRKRDLIRKQKISVKDTWAPAMPSSLFPCMSGVKSLYF